MRIGTREIGLAHPPYLIAEVGVNHEGSLDRAVSLIWQAARCGASAVKFQAYKADTLAHPESPIYFQQTGEPAPSQHAFFQRYDAFGPEDYAYLAGVCEQAGVDFLCTPFDRATVAWLMPLVAAWKIASADITNIPLLQAIGVTAKPVLLSTGAATLKEIQEATDWLAAASARLSATHVAMLHCVLAYPTPAEDANLLMIADLARRFPGHVIGYSDHTLATPEMEVCTMAYLLGARIIEKHFTDDKTQPGNDHAHSMDMTDLLMLKSQLDWVGTYLGSPDKGPVPVEDAARRFARRGLYAAADLPAGTALTLETVAILRPTAQIGPEEWARVVGRHLTAPLAKGAPLTWELLDGP